MVVHEPLELRQVDPSKNRFRVYRLTPCFDLFGTLCLFVEWGRLGRRLRTRLEPFSDATALELRLAEIVAIRKRHGYTA
jgi:predicted DNA-binding WGR domain protein